MENESNDKNQNTKATTSIFKKKKNGIKEVTRKCLNLIDIKYNNLTTLICRNNNNNNISNTSNNNCNNNSCGSSSSYNNKTNDVLTNYQFSDDEIKFSSDENSNNDNYFLESSYTTNDFKNLLGWVPRNLKISECTNTDSIPCAFFFSNNNQTRKSDQIILYLHKFNEDLGTIIPTINALHKKLNINIIAMEYSGYGVSFDKYEQKLVSIVNDAFTILKFIINYLKIPYNNICILCYEFLASCAIEVVNRFENTYGKNKPFGGLILIKPKFLNIISNISVINNENYDDITLTDTALDDIITNKNFMHECSRNQNLDEDVPMEYKQTEGDDLTYKKHVPKKKKMKKKNIKGKEKKQNHPKDEQNNININININSDNNNNNKSNRNNNNSNNNNSNNNNSNNCINNCINNCNNRVNKIRNRFFRRKNNKNELCDNKNTKDYTENTCDYYKEYNGIITCDMSLFYNNNHKYILTQDNDIPYQIMKRILKDTFDINHVKNTIKSISCPILIFHSEHYSYKNSSSNIILNNATESYKKAAFSFDFMNEDFITSFNWFFSQEANFQNKDKSFKNLLSFYIHPMYNNINYNDYKIKNETDQENNNNNNNNNNNKNHYHNYNDIISKHLQNNFNDKYINNNNHLNNTQEANNISYNNKKDITNDIQDDMKHYINIPNEIFICPEINQK
ncbi:hypothetical protein PFAG_01535 [Plasmodium falciparum Santa Lucia]|uniref:Serine aminopeptidase S33 domain-containing protein n=1 Tax=Plasmodium falciparum Santa Lucia TaxID=478859 RepID=W7FTG4_PLAFA|nr:hypothetical protein PFAG_01535 [Plasmodium falciparum Santa Lucia]